MRVISSTNGLEAIKRAYDLISHGADTLDAVVAAVIMVEDDPNDNTVGLGGFPNEDGFVELDAAVMHGPSHRAGAVAALQKIRNPSKVAKLIMEQTDHVLLVGEGALRFARAQGFQEEDLLTEKSRKIWRYWKEHFSKGSEWVVPPETLLDPDIAKYFGRPTGTVHVAAINSTGDMSCATSTSGLSFKIPGRVGDSSIIGAGLYVDNAVGTCGSTGLGETNMVNLSCFAAVELMRNGLSPVDAGLEVLKRIVSHNRDKRHQKEDGRPDFNVRFYLMSKDGRYAGVTLWGPGQFAIADENGARLEDCVALYTK